MRKSLILMSCILAFGACEKKDPIASLDEKTKYFLMGDDESPISFMGWPSNGGESSCNASQMGQGYSFKQTADGLFIESIRPSGIERHKINAINIGSGTIKIKAKNNANLPFALILSNVSENAVDISFDGEAKSNFVRCVR